MSSNNHPQSFWGLSSSLLRLSQIGTSLLACTLPGRCNPGITRIRVFLRRLFTLRVFTGNTFTSAPSYFIFLSTYKTTLIGRIIGAILMLPDVPLGILNSIDPHSDRV